MAVRAVRAVRAAGPSGAAVLQPAQQLARQPAPASMAACVAVTTA
jgi:hypothetical protein